MTAPASEKVPILVDDIRGAINSRLRQDEITVGDIISAASTFLNCALQHVGTQAAKEAYLEDAIRQLRRAVYGACGSA